MQALTMVIFTCCLLMADLVIYGLKQAKGQLSIIYYTRPIAEVLEEHTLSAKEKEKLKFIGLVKNYSVDSLGYKISKSYTTFYDQKNTASLWTITACEPYRFKAYTWKFPVLGEVSYKGYFDYKAALPEYEKLRKKGYDTDLSPVGAWSTLGFLSDPVLSGMLKKSKGRLANLIFHELFHNTYYAPGTVEVNENLANFIAHKATLLFLQNDTSELNNYLRVRADDSLNTAFVLQSAKKLDSLYLTFNISDTVTCNALKKKMLRGIYLEAGHLPLNFPERFSENNKDILITKNAFFMQYKRYDELYDSLNQVLSSRYHNNLKQMIVDLKQKRD